MAIKADPQGGLWDLDITNVELEELLDEHQDLQGPARRYRKVHKKLQEMLEPLEVGRRYRIGRFIVTPQAIAGGGFDIPTWESHKYDIQPLD